MQVDNISKSPKDPQAPKSEGIAKGALGWLHRMISGSAREISDFSSLLSAQTAIQELPPQKQSEQSEQPQCRQENSVAASSEAEVDQDQNTYMPAEVVKHLSGATRKAENAVKESNCEHEIEDGITPELTSEEAVPSEFLSAEETENEGVENIVSDACAVQETTADLMRSELLAAQLLAFKKSDLAAEKIEKDSEAAIATANSELAATEVPVAGTEMSDAEEVSLEMQKTLVDTAKKILEKQVAHDSKGQQIQTVKASAAELELKAKDSQQIGGGTSVEESPTLVFEPASSSTATLTKTSGAPRGELHQSFMASLSAQYMPQALGTREEGASRAVEGLGASRLASLSGKAALENNAGSLAQGSKAIESMSASSARAAVVSGSTGSAEQSQKNETAKAPKLITRSQSLAALERVEAALQKAAESKDGTLISLRLDPPSLGSVKVDVSFRDGLLHARLSADSVQVIQLLRERAPELQVTLRKLGLDVDRVSVSVNSGDSGAFSEGFGDREGSSGNRDGKNFPEVADSALLKEAMNLDHWVA